MPGGLRFFGNLANAREKVKERPLTSHATYLARRYFPAIDGLRALSVLPVVFHHATPRPLPGALGRGPLGVDLFFAISGFLITTLLLREARSDGRISLSAFYARRAFRIFPAYYVVALLHVAFAFVAPPDVRAHFFANLPFFLTYTTNWFVDFGVPHAVLFSYAWSLAAEEQFYGFWPSLMKLVVARASKLHAVLFGAMVLLLSFDALVESGLLFSGAGLLTRIASSFPAPIGFGVLFAIALDDERTHVVIAPILSHPVSRGVILAACVAAFAVGIPIPAAFLAFAALVAMLALRDDSWSSRALSTAPLRFVGTLSYAIYLTHVAALGVVRRSFPEHRENAFFVFGAGLPLVLGLAALLHYAIERPWLRRGRRPPVPKSAASSKEAMQP